MGRDADMPEGIKPPGGYNLRAMATMLAILMLVFVWLLGIRYLPLPRLGSFAVYAVIGALVAAFIWGRVLRSRARKAVGELPKKLPESAGRLRAVGKPAKLAQLTRMGDLRDETFEPLVIFAPRVTKMPKVGTALMVVTAIAVAALIEVLRETTTLPLVRPGWLTIMAGIAVGAAVQMLVWPTYTRVTPGRLDIMRYTLGLRKPQLTTINLRNAQVLAHLEKATLLIKPEEPGSTWTLLNLRGVWNPVELAYAVLRGAASTAPTPPLPDDQLLG